MRLPCWGAAVTDWHERTQRRPAGWFTGPRGFFTPHQQGPAIHPPSRANLNAKLTAASRRHTLADQAKGLMDRSYKSCFSLDQFARRLESNPRTLRNAFKDRFGFSLSHYQTHLRIQAAKRLLDQGTPIKQIPAQVGFFDQSHLTRHFKRLTGKTPAQYLANPK